MRAKSPKKRDRKNTVRTTATSVAVAAAIGFILVARHAAADDVSKDAGSGSGAQHGHGSGPNSGSGKGKGGRDSGPIAVRVETAAKRLSPRVVSVVTALQGRRQADVFTKVLGRVSELGPAEGDAVKAGQVLFRVDRSDPGETFLNSPVVSPISGWIGRWRITNLGEQVSPQDAVVTVVDDTALRAQVFLPANDWLLVKKDTRVTAIIFGERRAAAILTVAQSADPASGRGSVTIEIANPKRDWRAGLFATLSFELDPKERMLIGSAGMSITDQGSYVFIVDDSSGTPLAKRVGVTFDVVDSDTVEILSGLEANAKVISAGSNLLGDKSPVKIVSDAPAGDASGSDSGSSPGEARPGAADKKTTDTKAAVVP